MSRPTWKCNACGQKLVRLLDPDELNRLTKALHPYFRLTDAKTAYACSNCGWSGTDRKNIRRPSRWERERISAALRV